MPNLNLVWLVLRAWSFLFSPDLSFRQVDWSWWRHHQPLHLPCHWWQDFPCPRNWTPWVQCPQHRGPCCHWSSELRLHFLSMDLSSCLSSLWTAFSTKAASSSLGLSVSSLDFIFPSFVFAFDFGLSSIAASVAFKLFSLGFQCIVIIRCVSVVVAVKQTRILTRNVVVFLCRLFTNVFLGWVCNLNNLLFVVAIQVLWHFHVLHKRHCFSRSFGHGVKVLTVHFWLPPLGHSAQESVGNFIGARQLCGVEIGCQQRNLLMVDAIDMEKAILHLHVQWLSSSMTQMTFDALQDFVGHEWQSKGWSLWSQWHVGILMETSEGPNWMFSSLNTTGVSTPYITLNWRWWRGSSPSC